MIILPVVREKEVLGYLAFDRIGGTKLGAGATHVSALVDALGYDNDRIEQAQAFVREHGQKSTT